jgi:cytoskeleton protein RodZ
VVTQQDAGRDEAQEIQRQFALLQEEMRRVMAESQAGHPAPQAEDAPEDDIAQFRRIELGLEALRRDTDRLRSRIVHAADSSATTEAIAGLRERIEEIARQSAEIGRRTEESVARLSHAVQWNRDLIDEATARLERLGRRRPSRVLLPLAILLGAAMIAAAVLLATPGTAQMLIDRINAIVSPAAERQSTAAPAAAPHDPATETAPAPPPSAAALPPPPADAPPPAAPAVDTGQATPPPAAADEPATRGSIMLRAKADTWVEVRNRQGAPVIARLMRQGDTWAVPDQSALSLSTGNAGGLELLVDGIPAPPLGAVGLVRRDIPLDANLIRAGHYTAKPSATSQ